MNMRDWWVALAFLTGAVNAFGSQETEKFDRLHAALDAVFPATRFSVWEGTEGDVDGDGVSDYAAVVVLDEKDGGREERVVVLAGTLDGKYKPISVSGSFCQARKSYGLSIEKNSLLVQVFDQSDSAHAESFTLAFRYNAKLTDLELIGEESLSEDYESGAYYRVSTSYLTMTVIHSRHAGKRDKQARARLSESTMHRLKGFECSGYGSADAGFYIDENFKVRHPSSAQ